MRVLIKFSNPELFENLVQEVDCNGLTALTSEEEPIGFEGIILIHTKDGKVHPFYGFIEADSFEEDYGFILEISE
jgi:hypothetical protein